jgi:WD40 repeat protein
MINEEMLVFILTFMKAKNLVRSKIIILQKDKLYVSGDDNKVAIYSLSEMTHEGILSRASAPITCLSLSANGKYIASGGW